jgi:hypothetical protein
MADSAHLEKMAELGITVPTRHAAFIHTGMYNALTEERSKDLVKAIAEYPTFKTACAACFVSDKTVMSWLRRGTMADATPAMAQFAANFLKADADHAKNCYDSFRELAAGGNGTASQILKYMTSRWHHTGNDDLMTGVDAGKKRTDNLESLLRAPTARLAHMLHMTGWVRHPAWGTEAWGKVVDTTGIEAPKDPA